MRRNKYNAIPTVIDGIRFASKAEANYCAQLKILQRAGEIKYFLMQVPFYLPGGIKYVVDFVVFHNDGTVDYVDVKGVETKEFKLKKKLVEEFYPVKIMVVKKGKFTVWRYGVSDELKR